MIGISKGMSLWLHNYPKSRHKPCWISIKRSGNKKAKNWIKRRKRFRTKLVHWKEPLKNSRENERSSGRNAPELSERNSTSQEDITHAVKGDHQSIARKVEDMTKENALSGKYIEFRSEGLVKVLLLSSRCSTQVATYLCMCTLRLLTTRKLRIHESNQKIIKRLGKRQVGHHHHPTLFHPSHRKQKP